MSATLSPTPNLLDSALRATERCEYENDGDGGRDEDEWRRNVFYGNLAERVAYAWLHDEGIPVRLVSDTECSQMDLDLFGAFSVDVKLRYVANYPDPDLLVRRRTAVDSVDAYLMVELDDRGTKYCFNIVGFATAEDVEEKSEPFRYGSYRKRLVPREGLRPPEELPEMMASA